MSLLERLQAIRIIYREHTTIMRKRSGNVSSRVTRSEKCSQKTPGCGGDDIIDTISSQQHGFAASSFYSCTARVVIVTSLSKSLRTRARVIGSVTATRSRETSSRNVHTNKLLMKGLQVSLSRPLVRWESGGLLEWLQALARSVGFRRGTLRSQFVSSVMERWFRLQCVKTALVRARPPSDALQAPWC